MLNFSDFSPDDFLANYWQKQPCLFKGVLQDYKNPVIPNELAGLACEDGVESRLVKIAGTPPANSSTSVGSTWLQQQGPFKAGVFSKLPKTHWTLLVQAADQYYPELADLLDEFSFIPHWRIDDLMISYGPTGGSVGPHYDSYDVFLIQVRGRKRWEISRQFDERLRIDTDMRILEHFEAEQSWELEPGDMLYLPPNVAHHGVALDTSMTFSVGFLAPSQQELVGLYMDDWLTGLDEDGSRYVDPDLKTQPEPGQIDPEALLRIREMVRTIPMDDVSIDRWFGRYVSEPRLGIEYEPLLPPLSSAAWLTQCYQYTHLRRHCRLFYIERDDKVYLFANGDEFVLPTKLASAAALLSRQRLIECETLLSYVDYLELLDLLTELTNQGYFEFGA